MALSLDQEVVRLREQVAQLLALVGELRGTIEQQQAHIAKLVKMTFGRTGERIEGPTLFDALPAEPLPTPAASDTPLSPGEPASKRKGHGRKSNSADLPRRREELDLSEASITCRSTARKRSSPAKAGPYRALACAI